MPLKDENFMWRSCGNYLATNWNLWKKMLKNSTMCSYVKRRKSLLSMLCNNVKAIVWVCNGLGRCCVVVLGQCGGSRGLMCMGR